MVVRKDYRAQAHCGGLFIAARKENMDFAHVFVWHYYDIQIVALVVLLLFIGWMVWQAGYIKGHEKGWSKGQEDAHEFHARNNKT